MKLSLGVDTLVGTHSSTDIVVAVPASMMGYLVRLTTTGIVYSPSSYHLSGSKFKSPLDVEKVENLWMRSGFGQSAL